MAELNLDTFGEIIDSFLTKQHSMLLLESVEGTQEVTVTGLGGVSVLQFYFLLRAIPTGIAQVCADMGIDATSPEWSKVVDELLGLIKNELVVQKGDTGDD